MSRVLESIENLSEAVNGRKLDTDTVAKLHNIINEAKHLLDNIEHDTGGDRILLKWGTFKAWRSDNPAIKALINGVDKINPVIPPSGPSNNQRRMICEVIDLTDGVIRDDFSGKYLTKDEAKEYVMSYGK